MMSRIYADILRKRRASELERDLDGSQVNRALQLQSLLIIPTAAN